MMPRIEWMYWSSTVRHLLNSSPIFSDVRDEAPSTMRETKERSPNDNWEWQLFVLLISLAMRFVVLYTWFKEKCPQSSLIVKKWTTYTIWVAFGFTFIGNPEEINPSFQLQQLMRRHQFFSSRVSTGSSLLFLSSISAQPSTRRRVLPVVLLLLLPSLAASSLAAAGWQTVVQRIAQRLWSLQDLRATWG